MWTYVWVKTHRATTGELGEMRWPPAKINQCRSFRSPAEGAITFGSSVHFSQEVAYPGQVFLSVKHRNCGNPHFSFLEGFFHLSSPVKSLPGLALNSEGNFYFPMLGSSGSFILPPTTLALQSPWHSLLSLLSAEAGWVFPEPLLRPQLSHLQAVLEKIILTPWFKALPCTLCSQEKHVLLIQLTVTHPKPSPSQTISFQAYRWKKEVHFVFAGNVFSRQPHPWFPFHVFHSVPPQDNRTEGTLAVIFVWLAFIKGHPTL